MKKTVGIISNMERDMKLATTRDLLAFLDERGQDAVLPREVYAALDNPPDCAHPTDDVARDADFVVVIGGDGTILRAARDASAHSKPLLGINAGNLGFLTSVERKDARLALTRALEGHYLLERRMMLEAAFTDGRILPALNDVYIFRETDSLVVFSITINGGYIDTYAADGLIISTPTGSTAYNLAAGGPIAQPEANMIIVTPICPHALYARPWVLSAEDEIAVRLEQGAVAVSVDGDRAVGGQLPITVTRAKQETELMIIGQPGFYEVLRRKMMGR